MAEGALLVLFKPPYAIIEPARGSPVQGELSAKLTEWLQRFLHTLLHLQQPFLHLKSTGIPGKASVLSHNPMTGHYYGNWIHMIRHAHRAHGFGRAHCLSNLRIAARFPVRNLRKRLPDPAFKRRAPHAQRHGKHPATAGKVFFQLALRQIKQRRPSPAEFALAGFDEDAIIEL